MGKQREDKGTEGTEGTENKSGTEGTEDTQTQGKESSGQSGQESGTSGGGGNLTDKEIAEMYRSGKLMDQTAFDAAFDKRWGEEKTKAEEKRKEDERKAERDRQKKAGELETVNANLETELGEKNQKLTEYQGQITEKDDRIKELEKYERRAKERVKAVIDTLPEREKDLVNALSLDKQIEWLDKYGDEQAGKENGDGKQDHHRFPRQSRDTSRRQKEGGDDKNDEQRKVDERDAMRSYRMSF